MEFEVRSGETTHVAFALRRAHRTTLRFGVDKPGWLELRLRPKKRGAVLRYSTGKIQNDTTERFLFPEGRWILEARSKGCRPVTQEITIPAASEIAVRLRIQ